jgi:hypothetical protein
MPDLSWPHVKDAQPTPDERAERVLNLIFGRGMWSPFAKLAIAIEIRNVMNETLESYNDITYVRTVGGE